MSFGGSSRGELSCADSPLRGIFRWDEGVQEPVVTLRSCDTPGGQVYTQEIDVG